MPAWRPQEPFNALPLLPPKAELETRKLLKQCIAARAALAELKQVAELIPNQGVLINTLTLPILYLSRYIIQHKADYYRLLREVTQTDVWDGWVMFMLKGVEETARWTVARIASIRKLQTHTVEHVRKAAPKVYSHELVNVIFELPYCRIHNLTQRDIAGRQTASVYLKELVRIGVLEEKPVGREKLFIHPKLMRLLTCEPNDFAPYA